MFCGSPLREYSCTSVPRVYASSLVPSNLRSNSQSRPTKRSCVNVAAIGSSQSGIRVAPCCATIDVSRFNWRPSSTTFARKQQIVSSFRGPKNSFFDDPRLNAQHL